MDYSKQEILPSRGPDVIGHHKCVTFGDKNPVAAWLMDEGTLRFVNQQLVSAGYWGDTVRADIREAMNMLGL